MKLREYVFSRRDIAEEDSGSAGVSALAELNQLATGKNIKKDVFILCIMISICYEHVVGCICLEYTPTLLVSFAT